MNLSYNDLKYRYFHLLHDQRKQNHNAFDIHLTSLINLYMTMYNKQEHGIHHHKPSSIPQYVLLNKQFDMGHVLPHLLTYQKLLNHFH